MLCCRWVVAGRCLAAKPQNGSKHVCDSLRNRVTCGSQTDPLWVIDMADPARSVHVTVFVCVCPAFPACISTTKQAAASLMNVLLGEGKATRVTGSLLSGRRPTIVGELKVPGVSTYIHPLSREALLTIGMPPVGMVVRSRGWGSFVQTPMQT